MASKRIIVVTGANRGIGRAICQRIVSHPDLEPLRLIATSRGGEDLKLDCSAASNHEVLYRKLDIADRDSVRAFVESVAKDTGDVDVLINNAGINLFDDSDILNLRRTFDVNFRGTREMCQAILPHMRKDPSTRPRIVNLSSVASSLKFYTPALQQRFRDPNVTLEDLETIAQDYESAVETKTQDSAGFGVAVRSYGVSKALVTALTRLLARENPDVSINCCCPGWIATDMGNKVGRGNAPKTAEEGAQIPLHLAFDESVRDLSGVYWANESVRSREVGKVIDW